MDKQKLALSLQIPRWKALVAVLFLYVIIYAGCVFGPISALIPQYAYILIEFSPLLTLIVFCIYAAYTILRNVFRLKDYPEEAESLLRDVQEAKEGLRKRGYVE